MSDSSMWTIVGLFVLGAISLLGAGLPGRMRGCFQMMIFAVVLLALLIILPLAMPIK